MKPRSLNQNRSIARSLDRAVVWSLNQRRSVARALGARLLHRDIARSLDLWIARALDRSVTGSMTNSLEAISRLTKQSIPSMDTQSRTSRKDSHSQYSTSMCLSLAIVFSVQDLALLQTRLQCAAMRERMRWRLVTNGFGLAIRTLCLIMVDTMCRTHSSCF